MFYKYKYASGSCRTKRMPTCPPRAHGRCGGVVPGLKLVVESVLKTDLIP